MKTTHKNIVEFTHNYFVTDITAYSFEQIEELRKAEKHFEIVAFSVGTYGMSGKVVQGSESGKLYAITKRNGAMFQI